jgi:uncharacterized Zn finger protein (UPF0148 family)
MSSTDQNNVKRRAPRPCKNEAFMQEKLSHYKTGDSTCPTCWHAYKFAKADEKETKKQEKDEQKKNQPPVDQIRDLLYQAARRGHFGDKLAETPGKEKQAAGMKRSAQKAMTDAVQMYQGLAPDDHRHLDQQELEWLASGGTQIPLLSDIFDGDAASAEDEANRKLKNNKQIEKLVQEREVLHRRLSQFEKELAETKHLSQMMKQELHELQRLIKDKDIKKKLKKILDEANAQTPSE